MASESYEFKVNHTDATTTAFYYSASGNVVAMDEWFGRPLEAFAAGMTGRGFRHHVEPVEVCGRRWDSHFWTR